MLEKGIRSDSPSKHDGGLLWSEYQKAIIGLHQNSRKFLGLAIWGPKSSEENDIPKLNWALVNR